MTFFATLSESKTVSLWNRYNKRILKNFSRNNKDVTDIKFSKDGTIFAVVYQDSLLELYST